MELTFDPYSWLPPARSSRQGDASFAARLDWPALAARLSAAHAFQRHALRAERAAVLARSSFDQVAREGSFHEPTARLMAGFSAEVFAPPAMLQNDESSLASGEGKVLANVNPTSSGDRKDAVGMVSGVAGSLPSGNRGLK
jgi:hypothetical protein